MFSENRLDMCTLKRSSTPKPVTFKPVGWTWIFCECNLLGVFPELLPRAPLLHFKGFGVPDLEFVSLYLSLSLSLSFSSRMFSCSLSLSLSCFFSFISLSIWKRWWGRTHYCFPSGRQCHVTLGPSCPCKTRLMLASHVQHQVHSSQV